MNPVIEIITLVGKFAPSIASALGSPFAGIVTSILANAFKANPNDWNDILAKLKSDPDLQLKLETLADQHSKDLALINDTASARNREMAFTTATKTRDWMLPILACVVAIGFFVTIWFVIHLNLPDQDKYFLYGLIFGIGVQFAQVYNYYFGQSTNDAISLLSAPFVKAYNTVFKSKP